MQADVTSQSLQVEKTHLAQHHLAYVTGSDAKKVGIVQSVISHLGVDLGSMSKAGVFVLVDEGLEVVKKCRQDLGDTCWILALTESGSAGTYLSAGASDVLTGKWSVNDLCDRVDVAMARMGETPVGDPSMIRREGSELVSKHSGSEAVGMVEWMLRGAEDTITRMTLAHAMVEKKCRGVEMASAAVEDLRQMTSELAAAVRTSPDTAASCDLWSVLAGGLGLPLLGEGRAMIADLPERLPALRGSRHTMEYALRSLVIPLVRDSYDGQIAASAMLDELGDQLLVNLDYRARETMAAEESMIFDAQVSYRRTTERLFTVAAAKISSRGGELLATESAGFLQLRLPVMTGAVESSREDTAEPTRVVLIEPDESLRRVLEQYLSMQNVHTLALPSIERAGEVLERAAASSFAPDVCVVAMQTAGGMHECAKIRRISAFAPLIATVSGDLDEAEVVRRLDGVSEVLRKPYTAETLLERAMELALDPS